METESKSVGAVEMQRDVPAVFNSMKSDGPAQSRHTSVFFGMMIICAWEKGAHRKMSQEDMQEGGPPTTSTCVRGDLYHHGMPQN